MGRPGNRNGGRRRYCSQCGAAVAPDDRFCSDCGARQDVPRQDASRRNAPRRDVPRQDASRRDVSHQNASRQDYGGSGRASADVSGREYEAFRRRVRERLNEGWEIEYDGGDYVVLVDREFGSLWWHAFFLVFTGGIGNLLYAWYKYSVDADRLHLSADDEPATPERAPPEAADDSSESSIGSYLAGIFLAGIGAAAIASSLSSPPGIAFGTTMLLAGLFLLPPVRERLRNRHPVTAFGPTKSVDERVVSDTDRPCSQCFSQVDRGLVREYKEEYAVAGLPLYTIESGENYYCEDCVAQRRQAVADVGGGSHRDESTDAGADADESDLTLADLDVEDADVELDDADVDLSELVASRSDDEGDDGEGREYERENA